MTISTEPTPLSYSGDGSNVDFPITWKYFAKSHVVATLRDSDGEETTWVLNTNYTLTDAGVAAGGTLTATAAPAMGETLVIDLDPPNTQTSSLPLGGAFPSTTVEAAIDIAAQRDSKLEALFNRSLRVPKSDTVTDTDLELPIDTERANMFLAFNADGEPIAAAGTSANLGPVSSFIDTLLVAASAAAARTTLGALAATDIEHVCQGRLTLTSGTPVTTSDVTAATTVYFAPYKGRRIALYDGSTWALYAFTELSIAVPSTTDTVYDLFVYNNAGTLTLEATAWTNDTTRATALTTQNGVLVKTGATTRRFIGSYRTTGVSGQTEDSEAKRYVWNYYNRVRRPMRKVESTDTWNYSTATYRQANGSTANQLDCVIGVSEDMVSAEASAFVVNSTSTNRSVSVGIGLDSTSVNSAMILRRDVCTDNIIGNPGARYQGYPGIGRRTLVWLEAGNGSDTQSWSGDSGVPTLVQSGIIGEIFG